MNQPLKIGILEVDNRDFEVAPTAIRAMWTAKQKTGIAVEWFPIHFCS